MTIQDRPLWTHNKARLIERYLFYFVLITKRGAYIDGFAAPQRRDPPDLCSCKLVLESRPQLLREFWLCDLKPEGTEALRKIASSIERPKNRSISIVEGDFNVRVHEILRDCKIGEKTAASCLLDQRTFECKWETVKTLAQFKQEGPKIELFYFLATGWLDRAMAGATKNKELLRTWWGRDDWQKLRGMKGHVRANLVADRFKRELGYAHAYPFAI
ncbi:three-Cys-motif partner protein TcmP [Bradyrhizobium sp. LHD-71]|uniref:three-Cys-motif partner protein TcmP n=1 Tax=Bradyrhizobium sp. LHD-71 TaxID=3072141 RepID=UPI0028100EC2|nr:three-Cys-motif partner protein TcmP [Bradyrhizobium sp. LHD-71]MDQ8732867.1 three-Cys-motif partner protein TcmP [Bradyrhizobium sp. LHD-71]